ncbi:MAG: ATP-binding response regulator, partial [Terriglobales bacterium]
MIKTVHNNSVKLLQMVSGLLDFSKLEAGTLEVHRNPVDAVTLVKSVCADCKNLAQRKKLTLTVDCPDTLVVNLDRYLFERIVFNLLSNAIKYTPGDGRVAVRLEPRGDRLILMVTDNGIGIAQEEQRQIFKEFHRLAGVSTRRPEGLGLGLALVRDYAGLLEGQVSVQSKIGRGSTFAVDVYAPHVEARPINPVGTTDGAKLLCQLEVTLNPLADVSRGDKTKLPRVLIAESNSELASYLADLLGEMCNPRIAEDGEKALELVYDWRPDLLLSAYVLPKIDGLELCRKVKASNETAMISFVLLTSFTQRDAMLKGWEAGADEYLFKPFHP